jgi:hypothetical protein
MSMFRRRYNQMFFSSIPMRPETETPGRARFSSRSFSRCLRPIPQSVAGPIDQGHPSNIPLMPAFGKTQSVTKSPRRRSIRTMQAGKTALESPYNSMEDTLQTHPIEKRNANNLVGQMRNNIID